MQCGSYLISLVMLCVDRAVIADWVTLKLDNARAGWEIAFEMPGSGDKNPITGQKATALSANGNMVEMFMPFSNNWNEIYEAW